MRRPTWGKAGEKTARGQVRGGDAYIKASTGEPPPVFLDSFVAKVTFLMHTKTWTTSAMKCFRLGNGHAFRG